MAINDIAILGLGLIGGSLARALKRTTAVRRITGFDRDANALRRAGELRIVDCCASELAAAVAGADLIVVAVPLGAIHGLLIDIAPHLRDGTIVTDVAGVKHNVIASAREILGGNFRNFVPGHPIAGTERSGVEAGFAELFDHHRVILTPTAETTADAIAAVRQLWTLAGADDIVCMAPDHHDEILAATSHVPHVLAYALVECLAAMETRTEIFKYAAGGFADFTRIASSSPEMWHDITMANRTAIFKVLVQYEATARAIADALAAGDSERLKALFYRAKEARDRFVDKRSRA